MSTKHYCDVCKGLIHDFGDKTGVFDLGPNSELLIEYEIKNINGYNFDICDRCVGTLDIALDKIYQQLSKGGD